MKFKILFCILILQLTTQIFSQPFGIDTRTSNTSLIIDSLPNDQDGQYEYERVFPRISFWHKMQMTQAPGQPDRIYVGMIRGLIQSFPRKADPDPSEIENFLSLEAQTLSGASVGEQGMLSFAFDPNYQSNGWFYVAYSFKTGEPIVATRLSRFTNDNPNDFNIDAATEEVLMELPHTTNFHKSFHIVFGPDDMLYIATGDGGPQGDIENRAQDTTKLYGKVLRIDVSGTTDTGLPYHIPLDNPFYNGGPAGENTRKEIYAYGFRNPWKMSFDRENDYLFLGDVGWRDREEINVVQAGGNYGWNILEGTKCLDGSEDCDTSGLIPPIAEYDHAGSGASVTGGYVYYGTEHPELYGTYLYADFVRGVVYGLKYNGALIEGPFTLTQSTGLLIVSLFQDIDGEVFVMDYNGNGAHKLKRTTDTMGNDFPDQLSDMPDLLKAARNEDLISSGIYPYEPSAKLWSDGTYKTRLLALPNLEQIDYTETNSWNFPNQTILIKNFSLPMDFRDPQNSLRRLETRLLIRKDDAWHGFSYEWNDDQQDAQLLTYGKSTTFTIINEAGEDEIFTHLYPSRNQCQLCHTSGANGALGLSTAALNFDYPYPKAGDVVVDNQLRTFDHIGLFSENLPGEPATLPRMPDPFDESEPLQDRARAYLSANCSMCHRSGGTAPAQIDLRWEATNLEMNSIHTTATHTYINSEKGYLLNIPTPEDSVLHQRISKRDGILQMPPLGSNIVHQEGVQLIQDWLTDLQLRDREKIRQHLLGQTQLDQIEIYGADLNADEKTDISDGLQTN